MVENAIPSELSSPFIYDVTSSYINTCDLSVDIAVRPQQTHKYAYLCVFDNKNWRPITSARVRWRKAVFSEMGKNIMYLPAFYVGGKMQAANYPFEVGYNGKIRYYNPDTVHTYNLRLYRKYPTTFRVIGVTSHMVGGEIQAADNPEFKNPKIFHRLKKIRMDFIFQSFRILYGRSINIGDICLRKVVMGILQNYNSSMKKITY